MMATLALGAEWDAVQGIAAARKIEVRTRDGAKVQGTFRSATAESVVVQDKSGERAIARADVREVRVYDAGRRVTRGLLWTAVGAGVGAGMGVAVCPYCENEGHGGKFVPAGAAVGAGIGALGFLSSPYRRIYRNK